MSFMPILRDVGAVISTALGLAALIYTWLTARAKANTETIDAVKSDARDQERRIDRIESEMAHLPDKESVHALQLGIAEMKGSMGRIEESLLGTNRTVRRMEEFLMESTK